MPLLGRITDGGPCPHTCVSRKQSNGETIEALETALASHASGCPACEDLQQRLQRFNAPMIAGPDTEWKQAEERLHNWLQSFLASDAAFHQAGEHKDLSRLSSFWRDLTQPFLARQMRWALVPGAVLALAIGSFLAGRISVRPSERMIAEATRSNEAAQSATPKQVAPESRFPAQSSIGEQRFSQPVPPNTHGSIARTDITPSAIGQRRPAGALPVFPRKMEDVAETRGNRPAFPSDSEKPVISSIPEPPQTSVPRASVPQAAPVNRAFQTARTLGSVNSAVPDSSVAISSGRATSPVGMAASRTPSGGAFPREARAGLPIAPPLPHEIKLGAGTRVWIALKSIHPRADGVSEFRGVVLLPVTQAGAVLLGRNAEVSGTIALRKGKKSVQLMGFLWSGTHYRLRSANGEASLRLLGAGEAVEFDAGRVLETWMASESTYEKLSGEGPTPEK